MFFLSRSYLPSLSLSGSILLSIVRLHLLLLLLLLACPLLPLLLLDLLHLLGVLGERAAELGPHFVGHRDRVAVGRLHLAHAHEHAVLIGSDVEEKPLVVHSQRRPLGQLRGLVLHAVIVNKFRQSVTKLNKSLRRQRDRLALRGSQTGPPVNGLSNPQEPSPLVLLQIHVVFPILAHQELALERAPGLVLQERRVAGPQLGVVFDEVPQVVAELDRHGHGEREAALVSAGPDFGYLQEAALRVLLHVQVEPFVLDVNPLRRQLLGLVLEPGGRARPAGRGLHGTEAWARRCSSLLAAAVSVRHDAACLPSPSVCCKAAANYRARRNSREI